MIKKVGLILFLLIAISSSHLFGHSLGLQVGGGLTNGFNNGAALTGSIDGIPLIFGLSVAQANNTLSMGVTADHRFWTENLTGALNAYAAVGARVGLIAGDSPSLSLGARLPLGINIYPIEPVEIFLEVAPTIGVDITPFNLPSANWLDWALGFRVWF